MTRARLSLDRDDAIRYRLQANQLTSRLAPGAYPDAARFGLQDSAPRDALVALHARVGACSPTAWADPRLIQTYSPRAAVHVLPRDDLGIFTLGRLPLDRDARRAVESLADETCRALGLGGPDVPEFGRGLRTASATGRIELEWTTSSLTAREIDPPAVDVDEAHLELCRRHLHACAPTTPAAFAWWSGLSVDDARQMWTLLGDELMPVDLAGRPAWILRSSEPVFGSLTPQPRARLLPAPDLRLFGADRDGLFVGPGMRRDLHLHDSFHPNGLMLDGHIAGRGAAAWATYTCVWTRGSTTTSPEPWKPKPSPCRSRASMP